MSDNRHRLAWIKIVEVAFRVSHWRLVSANRGCDTVCVYHWSGSAGGKLIGQATLDLELEPLVLHDLWLPLDTQGSIRVWVCCDESAPLNPIQNITLPPFHLQLERDTYYSGEVVRGALILNLAMAAKKHKFAIRAKSFTRTTYNETSLKPHTKEYYFWDKQVKKITTPRIARGRACEAGFHIVPFKIQLPATLPPTMDSEGYARASTHLVIEATADIDGKEWHDTVNLKLFTPTTLVPVPTDVIREPSVDISSLHDPENHVKRPLPMATVEGPPHVSAGQTVALRCKISNWSDQIIEFFTVTLRQGNACYVHPTQERPLTLRDSEHYPITLPFVDPPYSTWTESTDVPLFPLPEKGTAWEGIVSVYVPEDIEPTIPFTISPILGRTYYYEIHLRGRKISDTTGAHLPTTEPIYSVPNSDIVDVFNNIAKPPPNIQEPMKIISDGHPGTIGPIYCYLEPFSEEELAKFETLLQPTFPHGQMKYVGCDLGFLFERDVQPSNTARNTASVKQDSKTRLVTPELWTPGNMPSWAHR